MEQQKDSKGQFTRKSTSERKVRTIRMTNEVWYILGEKANELNMNRADFLEALINNQVGWKN